jgi:phosphopantetheinyl transferase
MEGMISVREAMSKYTGLETIMGFTEVQLEELIQNGEIVGSIDHSTQKVLIDKGYLKDLVAICNEYESSSHSNLEMEEDWTEEEDFEL